MNVVGGFGLAGEQPLSALAGLQPTHGLPARSPHLLCLPNPS